MVNTTQTAYPLCHFLLQEGLDDGENPFEDAWFIDDVYRFYSDWKTVLREEKNNDKVNNENDKVNNDNEKINKEKRRAAAVCFHIQGL